VKIDVISIFPDYLIDPPPGLVAARPDPDGLA